MVLTFRSLVLLPPLRNRIASYILVKLGLSYFIVSVPQANVLSAPKLTDAQQPHSSGLAD